MLQKQNRILLGEKKSDGEWTKAIMSALSELCIKPNWDTTYSSKMNKKSEWLYDFVAYTYKDADNKFLKKIHLIVESEWLIGEHHIQYDFEKLMVGRSNYRLMIFQDKTNEKIIKEIIPNLKETISGFEQSIEGDRYLFAGWSAESSEFIFDNYVKK